MTKNRRTCLTWALVVMVVCVAAAAGVYLFLDSLSEYSPKELEATTQAAEALTSEHGAEASQVIESYKLKAGSLETWRDPNLLKELMTEQQFQALSYLLEPDPESYWIVTQSVNVDHIRVVEYSPDRFKAVACLTAIGEERDPTDERVLDSLLATEYCAIYVFVSEERNWKLAASFETTDPGYIDRDWYFLPDWVKEEIGELPYDPDMSRERY